MIFYDGNFHKKKSNQGLLDDFTDRENEKEKELFIQVNAPEVINMYVGASVELKVYFNGDDLTTKADNDNIIQVGNIILG